MVRELQLGQVVNALTSAAPLVSQLHDVSLGWTKQPKGQKLTYREAVEAVCDFPESPCPLFASPRRLLLAIGARTTAVNLLTVGGLPIQERLARTAVKLGWQASTLGRWPTQMSSSVPRRVDVLLLEMDGTAAWQQQVAQVQPALVLLFEPLNSDHSSVPATATVQGQHWRTFGFRSEDGIGTVATLLWSCADCDPPLWDLSRPVGKLYPMEVEGAAVALRAGLAFAEWFACRTLEPLQHIVRSLFVTSRSTPVEPTLTLRLR